MGDLFILSIRRPFAPAQFSLQLVVERLIANPRHQPCMVLRATHSQNVRTIHPQRTLAVSGDLNLLARIVDDLHANFVVLRDDQCTSGQHVRANWSDGDHAQFRVNQRATG